MRTARRRKTRSCVILARRCPTLRRPWRWAATTKAFEIDTLARVHFMLGDVDKAIDPQKKAIALAPDRETYQKALKKLRGRESTSKRDEIMSLQ
jgi:hypothetical protein